MWRRTLERVPYEGRFDHAALAQGRSLRRELPLEINPFIRKIKPSNRSLHVLCMALLGTDFGCVQECIELSA